MSEPTGTRPRRALALAFGTLIGIVLCGGLYWLLREGTDPVARAVSLNRGAWEATFRERGMPVPEGPREGYWGTRLRPHVEDPELGWVNPPRDLPGLLSIDERGFQVWRSGSPAASRIFVSGGSVAFGAYASGVDATWFAQAGRRLAATPGAASDFSVLAAGAWKSTQELAALRRYAGELAPDLVLLVDGLNDLTNGGTADAWFGVPTPTRDGSEWSALYHAGDYDARVKLYLTTLRSAARVAREAAGADTLIVLQPALFERSPGTAPEQALLRAHLRNLGTKEQLRAAYAGMREGLRALAETADIHFLDASRLFEGERATTFSDMWHFSDPGHALLGAAVAERVEAILAARAAARTPSGLQ